ncbi:MAG: SDR family oxidoreductase [Proteobacteria bacterium]|nr:SDR family oxidoreductase [Pseudomonadota bacterium]
MSRRLEGRVALVTAAGTGIGRACALRLAREGAALVVNDIEVEPLERVCGEIRELGGTALPLAGDVSRPEIPAALVEAAVERHGRLDVVHNNAGLGIQAPLHETSDEDWLRQFAVGVDAAFFATRAALRVMRRQRSGSIVNTASGAALAAEPNLGGYASAKSALLGLTRTTAVENAALGIRANVICPGSVETPTLLQALAGRPGGAEPYLQAHPQRRLGRVEEIAALVAFLASDESSHINGAAIPIDGGVSAQRAAPAMYEDPPD